MKLRLLFLSLAVLGLVFGLTTPAQAAKTHKGKVAIPQAPAWVGLLGHYANVGPDTITGRAFAQACLADRVLVAAGQKPQFINGFMTSPLNGIDAFVVDLGKETMGAFAVKGPGAKGMTPELPLIGVVPEYDLDMDFYVDPTVDPTAARQEQCIDANEKATAAGQSHKCNGHKPTSDEKVPCITGYKDSKGKLRGARYVLVSATLNLKGPMDITLTSP